MPIQTFPILCGHCGRGVGAEIVQVEGLTPPQLANLPPGAQFPPETTLWLRCPTCTGGSVRTNTGAVYPAAPAGRAIQYLPRDIERAWHEGRVAHNVAAYTAAEMMFRKILMHVAVDKAGASEGSSFSHYVDALDAAGYIATGLKTIVDPVRTRGNTANHELPASTESESLATMNVTEHLLASMYELPGMAAAQAAAAQGGAPPPGAAGP